MLEEFLRDTTIPYERKFFKWYTKLPLISAMIIFAIFFILGFIDLIVLGFIGLINILNYCLIWIIGAVIAVVVYFIKKMEYSQRILTVLYLEKICESSCPKKEKPLVSDAEHSVDKEL